MISPREFAFCFGFFFWRGTASCLFTCAVRIYKFSWFSPYLLFPITDAPAQQNGENRKAKKKFRVDNSANRAPGTAFLSLLSPSPALVLQRNLSSIPNFPNRVNYVHGAFSSNLFSLLAHSSHHPILAFFFFHISGNRLCDQRIELSAHRRFSVAVPPLAAGPEFNRAASRNFTLAYTSPSSTLVNSHRFSGKKQRARGSVQYYLRRHYLCLFFPTP